MSQIVSHSCRGLVSTGAVCALAPAIFKIRLLTTRNFLTFYYYQAGVSPHNGKIILSLSTRNIKILTRPLSCTYQLHIALFTHYSLLFCVSILKTRLVMNKVHTFMIIKNYINSVMNCIYPHSY